MGDKQTHSSNPFRISLSAVSGGKIHSTSEMLLFVLSVAVVPPLLVLAYFTALFFYQCWILRKFSGPFAIPIVGNCYTPEALSILKYFASMRKRFGKVFVFFGFTKARLVVMDPPKRFPKVRTTHILSVMCSERVWLRPTASNIRRTVLYLESSLCEGTSRNGLESLTK